MGPEIFTLLMFVGLLIGLFLGHPLAFVLGGVAVIGAFVGPGLKIFPSIINNIYSGAMDNYVLAAIPLFVLMAGFLSSSGVTDKMFHTLRLVLSDVRGGLAFTVVAVSIMLAATTGIVGASITVMGMIALVPMLKYGYNKELSTGVIMASGSLGILIPPSIMLIVMASFSPVSVGQLFAGALIPGLLLASVYALYVAVICLIKPNYGPKVESSERENFSNAKLFKMVFMYVLPPMVLILGVLGALFAGIATATEVSSIGVVLAFGLYLIFGDRSWQGIFETIVDASKTTTMVLLVVVGATAFTGVFSRGGGMEVIQNFLLAMPGGSTGALIMMFFLIFILGMFLDWTGIVLLSFPIMLPMIQNMGIDALWFVVMTAVVLQSSFLTPPFGYALFYLKGVAPPEIQFSDLYKAVIPFCLLIILVCIILSFVPSLITKLPEILLK